MEKGGIVYIINNKYNKVLYTGVTSNLKFRIKEHKEKHYPKIFSARYNIDKLVYYKFYSTIEEAIAEEKRIKSGSRKAKIELIESINLNWKGLSNDL